MKKICAIVDAYSSGKLFASEFQKRGYECIHIQSTKVIPAVYAASFRPSDFTHNIVHEGDIEATIATIRAHSPDVLIAGIESGVLLADILSEALSLRTNGTNVSAARRDKYVMGETLRARGVRTAEQLRSNDLEKIIAWAKTRYPVVVKPIHSAGADSVSVCKSAAQIARATLQILGKTNKLGLHNAEVLVQEYLVGPEYIVDTVSCKGNHVVTDIWVYHRTSANGAPFVYDSVELLPSDGETQRALGDYIELVLNALEIANGPAHAEVIMTKTGPVLVEIGARVCGGDAPLINHDCIGYDQIMLTADAYTNEEAFARYPKRDYPIIKHGLVVYLISHEEGVVCEVPGVSELKKLESLFLLAMNIKPGAKLHRTVDIFTTPGRIDMTHANAGTLKSEYQRIRQLEKTQFYTLQ